MPLEKVKAEKPEKMCDFLAIFCLPSMCFVVFEPLKIKLVPKFFFKDSWVSRETNEYRMMQIRWTLVGQTALWRHLPIYGQAYFMYPTNSVRAGVNWKYVNKIPLKTLALLLLWNLCRFGQFSCFLLKRVITRMVTNYPNSVWFPLFLQVVD